MGQMGFFDLGNRYSGLDAKNEPLLKIDGVVPWEDLRARLEAVWRRADNFLQKLQAGHWLHVPVGNDKPIGLFAKFRQRPVVAAPKQRNSREENARIKAGETPAGWEDKPAKRRQKDVEARWTKKHGKSHYGYKNPPSVASSTFVKPKLLQQVAYDPQHRFVIVDDEDLVRAKARIGLKNLAYNMRRLVQLERLAAAV